MNKKQLTQALMLVALGAALAGSPQAYNLFFDEQPKALTAAASETKITVNPPAEIIVGDFFSLTVQAEPIKLEWQTGVQVVVNESQRQVIVTGGGPVAISTGQPPRPPNPPNLPPSSSLKSAVRAWAQNQAPSDIARIKGLYSGLIPSPKSYFELLAAQRVNPGISAACWASWRAGPVVELQRLLNSGTVSNRTELVAVFTEIVEVLD